MITREMLQNRPSYPIEITRENEKDTFPIGCHFLIDGREYVVVNNMDRLCHKCCFYSQPKICGSSPECRAQLRTDHKKVIYAEV